jgi:hypothetical protein
MIPGCAIHACKNPRSLSWGGPPIMTPLRTRWQLIGLVEPSGVMRKGLEIELSVDTTAEVVVDAIEGAARYWGIRLERVDDEPAPGRATSPARAAGSARKRTDEAESF